METAAQNLFALGTLVLVFAFAASIGHAVMLANGRRLRAAGAVMAGAAKAAVPGVPQPAWAGVASGSFVESQAAIVAAGPTDYAAPSPLSTAARWLTLGSFAILATSMTLRAIVVGRGPWGNLFEFTVAFATSILFGYLVLARRYPIRSIGFIPVGVSLLLALYASSLPSDVEPLVPALQNAPLLTIHVGLAMLSYGVFATSFAAGIAYLVQGKTDRYAWLPSHRVLDSVAYRAVIIGFPIFATMIILGSWWASIAWSRYWGWDPKETSALVTWLVYAIYLHARNQRAWAGRPAALLLVVGFVMVLVTLSGSLWFNGLHAYSGL
ncbi:MAG TPA: cytochrome c biogenesis protein CcsA [Candidatus Limnocylindrales bacterium]|jgi:cytochrome c-type biogenesis protein CcsB|nr:cytochrome c biogenesis protein CcsA [Candidatus Limnocylindrales bacterium]